MLKSRVKRKKRGKNKSDVAYQNKDIVSKLAAEYLKDKSLEAYGLNLPRIVGVLPTNLPAIEANELRLDNLFEFEDGSVGIIDYESGYDDPRQKIKYLNYVARIAERYRKNGESLTKVMVIIIYTADIDRKEVRTVYDIGCLRFETQAAFLSELDADGIMDRLRRKINAGERLNEKEQMQFIVLPLARKGMDEKKLAIREEIELGKKIEDERMSVFLLSSLIVFSDKVIDEDMSSQVRRWIDMTKVGRIYEEEKRLAVQKLELEKEELIRKNEELKRKSEDEKEELKRKSEEEKEELIKKNEELIKKNEELIRKKEEENKEEKNLFMSDMVKKLISVMNMSDDDILRMMDVMSPAEIRGIRKEMEMAVC